MGMPEDLTDYVSKNRRLKERIKELEADIKIKQSVCETIEKEVTKINEELKKRIEQLEALMQRVYQYIPYGTSLQKEFEQALKGK